MCHKLVVRTEPENVYSMGSHHYLIGYKVFRAEGCAGGGAIKLRPAFTKGEYRAFSDKYPVEGVYLVTEPVTQELNIVVTWGGLRTHSTTRAISAGIHFYVGKPQKFVFPDPGTGTGSYEVELTSPPTVRHIQQTTSARWGITVTIPVIVPIDDLMFADSVEQLATGDRQAASAGTVIVPAPDYLYLWEDPTDWKQLYGSFFQSVLTGMTHHE